MRGPSSSYCCFVWQTRKNSPVDESIDPPNLREKGSSTGVERRDTTIGGKASSTGVEKRILDNHETSSRAAKGPDGEALHLVADHIDVDLLGGGLFAQRAQSFHVGI